MLDGAAITLATFTLNLLHPGFLLGKGNTWRREKKADAVESRRSSSPDNETVTDVPNVNEKKLVAEP